MADTDKTRECLEALVSIFDGRPDLDRHLSAEEHGELDKARVALRALGGEGNGKWWTYRRVGGGFDVRLSDGVTTIAHCSDEATARRIAKLPALERAARKVVYIVSQVSVISDNVVRAVHRLSAALDEKES